MANNKYRDITDSEKDQQKLQPDVSMINMPDVKDIPGQENIHVPNLREMSDTTISSDDEEGVGIWDNEQDEDVSNDRIGSARIINEDELEPGDENLKLDARLDEEEGQLTDDADDVTVTDDFVSADSDINPDELKALERTENMDTTDNENLFLSELDDVDFDGEKLNETTGFSGKDLDVPGQEDDDADEEIGEEDEENNEYSLGDTE